MLKLFSMPIRLSGSFCPPDVEWPVRKRRRTGETGRQRAERESRGRQTETGRGHEQKSSCSGSHAASERLATVDHLEIARSVLDGAFELG